MEPENQGRGWDEPWVGPGNVRGGAGKGMGEEPTLSSASYMPVLYWGCLFHCFMSPPKDLSRHLTDK